MSVLVGIIISLFFLYAVHKLEPSIPNWLKDIMLVVVFILVLIMRLQNLNLIP